MRYSKISFRSNEVLPYKFLGSAIRGVFGSSLKDVVCINPSRECKGCFAKDGCLFYEFYEMDNPKFRLNLEMGGKLDFDIILFNDKAPYVISALYKAFREKGITKERIKPDFKLYFNDELIFDGEFRRFDNKMLEFKSDEREGEITLTLKTPLRIKEKGKFVRDDINVETILRSIHHRKCKLTDSKITKLDFKGEWEVLDKDLSFVDLVRFSNRQKSKMKLGGIVGEIKLRVDKKTYKMLKLGELIGVGKQTTFGLGRVEIGE